MLSWMARAKLRFYCCLLFSAAYIFSQAVIWAQRHFWGLFLLRQGIMDHRNGTTCMSGRLLYYNKSNDCRNNSPTFFVCLVFLRDSRNLLTLLKEQICNKQLVWYTQGMNNFLEPSTCLWDSDPRFGTVPLRTRPRRTPLGGGANFWPVNLLLAGPDDLPLSRYWAKELFDAATDSLLLLYIHIGKHNRIRNSD